jgi:hypothetical protein
LTRLDSNIIYNLIEFYEAWNKSEKAEEWRAKLPEWQVKLPQTEAVEE